MFFSPANCESIAHEHHMFLRQTNLHLLRTMFLASPVGFKAHLALRFFPLLVLKGIFHYVFFFPGGLSKWKPERASSLGLLRRECAAAQRAPHCDHHGPHRPGSEVVGLRARSTCPIHGPPVVPLEPFFGGTLPSPTKIDYRQKGTLMLTSSLEDVASPWSRGRQLGLNNQTAPRNKETGCLGMLKQPNSSGHFVFCFCGGNSGGHPRSSSIAMVPKTTSTRVPSNQQRPVPLPFKRFWKRVPAKMTDYDYEQRLRTYMVLLPVKFGKSSFASILIEPKGHISVGCSYLSAPRCDDVECCGVKCE